MFGRRLRLPQSLGHSEHLLRLPREERTWHGALGGFVPYDFRMPTVEKIKRTFWNPDGAIVVNRVFGVGWTINLGAIVAKLRTLFSTD